MKPSSPGHREGQVYRARDFADLAGVTVRALHHYDRVGLLTPRRTAAEHRIYSARDLESVKQIVALKAIGVPLKDIAVLRDASGPALASVLRSPRASLEEQQRLLTRLITAIHDVEDALGSRSDAGPELLRRIVEVIDVQNHDDAAADHENDE